MELSIKTKGTGSDDQEMTLKLPVETLKLLQDTLANQNSNSPMKAGSMSSQRRDLSQMGGGFSSSPFKYSERKGGFSPLRSFGERKSQQYGFLPSNTKRDIGYRLDPYEEEEEENERRSSEIKSIIDSKVFTPKFWDIEGPEVISEFGFRPGQTQDPFLRSVSFQGQPNNGESQSQSASFSRKNPSFVRLPENQAQPNSNRLDTNNRSYVATSDTSRNYPLPTFGRVVESTLTQFDQDMQQLFKKAKNMTIETEIDDNNQITVVMTPKSEDGLSSNSDQQSEYNNQGFMNGFCQVASRSSSMVFNKKPEASHIKTSESRRNYNIEKPEDESDETKKSAEQFLKRLLGQESEENLSGDSKPEQNQGSLRPAYTLGRYTYQQTQSNALAKKNTHPSHPDDEEYVLSHNLDSASDGSQLVFKNKLMENSPSLASANKASPSPSKPKTQNLNKISTFEPEKMTQKKADLFSSHKNPIGTAERRFYAEEESMMKDEIDIRQKSNHITQTTTRTPSELARNHKHDLQNQENSMNNSNLDWRYIQIHNPQPQNVAPSSEEFPDAYSPIKPLRFGVQNDTTGKYSHLNLDMTILANENQEDVCHLSEAGLDTPVMKALSSIQGKIEELNCMMGMKSQSSRKNKPYFEGGSEQFSPLTPSNQLLNSEMKPESQDVSLAFNYPFDLSENKPMYKERQPKPDNSSFPNPTNKENKFPDEQGKTKDPSKMLMDQLRISRELMENRRRKSVRGDLSNSKMNDSSVDN